MELSLSPGFGGGNVTMLASAVLLNRFGTVSSQGYSYDRSLYPTSYGNASVSWVAGRLASFGLTQFAYDGSRLSQYSDGTLSTSLEYRYGRLFSETVQSGGLSTALEFVYGADGGPDSWIANFSINVVMGFPVSGVSFTIDMFRYYVWVSDEEKERRRRTTPALVFSW